MSIILSLVSLGSTELLYALIVAIVGSAVSVATLIIKNWCKLLSGTYAVVHRDERRRSDALVVYERTVEAEREDGPAQIEGPPADRLRRRLPRKRKRRRR